MNRRLVLSSLAALFPHLAFADWRRDNRKECDRIDEKLKNIETERRAGYTAKRGRQLLARREKLEEQRREKCR